MAVKKFTFGFADYTNRSGNWKIRKRFCWVLSVSLQGCLLEGDCTKHGIRKKFLKVMAHIYSKAYQVSY